MFVELIDVLRCTQPHEESWLVASVTATEGRHVLEGTLGCPVCRTEYPVRGGVADFTGASDLPTHEEPLAAPDELSPDDDMRLAALLDLSDPRGFLLLVGRWAARARALQSIVGNQLLLVNPPPGVAGGGGVSVLKVSERLPLPLAAWTARAAALDSGITLSADRLAAVVRPGGRVVGPVALPVPAGVREIARDAVAWVGERETSPRRTVSLESRRRMPRR